MTAEELLGRLEKVRRSGDGWIARCPSHDDRTPSLSISEGHDGAILIHCHAGCAVEAIVAKLGIEQRDLFASNVAAPGAHDIASNGASRRVVATYDYHDELGEVLFQAVRFEPKKFMLRRPDPTAPDGWAWNMRGVRRVLYHGPYLAAAVKNGYPVYIPEGEKDADALEDAGVIATTNPMGAGKWRDEYAEQLRGLDVTIVADKDEPGRKHAIHVAESLKGVAKAVRVVEAAEGKDAADHLAAGLTVDQFVPVESDQHLGRDEGHREITWQRLSDVEMRSIVFIDKPLFQADAFHLVVGRKGMGKGTLLAEAAARCTRGQLGEKRNVVWIASEDSLSIDIRPRIEAAGGDPSCVLVVETGWIQLPRDIDEISRAIAEFGDVGMLIIDPIGNHITGKDSNAETDIRDAIAPLNQLADDHKTMVFGVRHLTEKECRYGVLAAILGGSAWVQVPRVVLAIARDNEDSGITHIQCVAGNRLPPDTPGRMFRIDGVVLPELENEVTRAVWIGDSTKDVEAMLSTHTEKKALSKSATARELILDILETEGQQESDALDARVAHETGLDARTVRNLRSSLATAGLLKPHPDKDEFGAIKAWFVARTLAPRETTPDPEHESTQ